MDAHSAAPRRPGVGESLTEAEYDRLEALLGHGLGEGAMNLEEMNGFFAALICGPVTVPPSVYLEEIWGGEEAPFGTVAEVDEFLNLVMRHWNLIAGLLATPDGIFMPLLWTEEGEELARGNRWARGFMRGVNLCHDAWREIFQEEDRSAMMLPIMVLAHEHDPDPEMRSWKTPPGPEVRMNVLVELSVSVRRLYDYFLPRRTHEASLRNSSSGASRPKIGRNDPCYCGSGKKYKHCCGNVTVH
jgi:uncharacterized protein